MNPYLPSKHDPTMTPIPTAVGTIALKAMMIALPFLCMAFLIITATIIAHKHDKDLSDFQTRLSLVWHSVAYLILGCASLTGCGVAVNVLEDKINERQWIRRNFEKGTYYKAEFNSLEKER
jgi:uncharacterized membrane protein YjgN (DUF898 family)